MPFDLTATRNITNIRFRAKKTVPITISGDRGKASRCQRSSLSANIRCFVVFLLATTFGVEWLGWRSLPVKVVRDYYCVLLCTFLLMCAKFFFSIIISGKNAWNIHGVLGVFFVVGFWKFTFVRVRVCFEWCHCFYLHLGSQKIRILKDDFTIDTEI